MLCGCYTTLVLMHFLIFSEIIYKLYDGYRRYPLYQIRNCMVEPFLFIEDFFVTQVVILATTWVLCSIMSHLLLKLYTQVRRCFFNQICTNMPCVLKLAPRFMFLLSFQDHLPWLAVLFFAACLISTLLKD